MYVLPWLYSDPNLVSLFFVQRIQILIFLIKQFCLKLICPDFIYLKHWLLCLHFLDVSFLSIEIRQMFFPTPNYHSVSSSSAVSGKIVEVPTFVYTCFCLLLLASKIPSFISVLAILAIMYLVFFFFKCLYSLGPQ